MGIQPLFRFTRSERVPFAPEQSVPPASDLLCPRGRERGLIRSRYLRNQLGRIVYPVAMAAGDLVAFYSALLAGYFLRVHLWGHWFPLPFKQTVPDLLRQVWVPLVVLGIFSYEGLYTKRQPFWEETQHMVRAIFLSYLTIFAIVSLGKLSPVVSRSILAGTGFLSLLFVPLVRFWYKPFLHRAGIGVKRSILIGHNRWSELASIGLYRDHYMGIRILGWLALPEVSGEHERERKGEETLEEEPLSGQKVPLVPCLGTLDDLKELVREEAIRGAVIAAPYLRRQEIAHLIAQVQRHVLSVYVVPNIAQVSIANSELLYLFYEEIFLLGIHNNLKSRANRFLKSVSDWVIATFLLIPCLPLMAVIALAISVSSPGPVFYVQDRVGRKGKPFRIYKFRTMVVDADQKLGLMFEEHPELEEEFQERYKLTFDPRVTAVGRFLRKTSLDELPQIVNVLKGEMSLVGPRPVTRDELLFRYQDAGEDYCLVKPGMTGLWQVSGRSERGYGVRIRLDLWYIRNWSLWLDLVILIRTIGVVARRKGSW